MSEILVITKLTKDYGQGRGLFDFDMYLKSGEIVGLLGPNGAGKSTLLKMLTKHTRPTSGEIRFLGNNFNQDLSDLNMFDKIGFMPSEGGVLQDLNTVELFKYWSRFFTTDLSSRFTKFVGELKIDTKTVIKKLSFGNRKKVAFLFSILHSPILIILDEPTAGLDPMMQKVVLSVLSDLAKNGSTVFLSSHTLSEVQSICDRLYILREGKLVYTGTTKQVLTQAKKELTIINCSKEIAQKILKNSDEDESEWVGADLVIYTLEPQKIVSEIILPAGLEFYIERPTLEKTFSKFYE